VVQPSGSTDGRLPTMALAMAIFLRTDRCRLKTGAGPPCTAINGGMGAGSFRLARNIFGVPLGLPGIYLGFLQACPEYIWGSFRLARNIFGVPSGLPGIYLGFLQGCPEYVWGSFRAAQNVFGVPLGLPGYFGFRI
jgi:hypothetical protein